MACAEPAAEVDNAGVQSGSERSRAAKSATQVTVMSDAPKCRSCEPTCTCRPSHSGRRRIASTASSGVRPNFEAEVPGHDAFVRVRLDAGRDAGEDNAAPIAPHARARRGVEHDQRARLGRAAQELVLLVVAVDHEPFARQARAKRELELADRRNVGAKTFFGEQAQHGDRRERLRPVGDQRSRRRFEVRPCLPTQRRLVVDDHRRPELPRERARA